MSLNEVRLLAKVEGQPLHFSGVPSSAEASLVRVVAERDDSVATEEAPTDRYKLIMMGHLSKLARESIHDGTHLYLTCHLVRPAHASLLAVVSSATIVRAFGMKVLGTKALPPVGWDVVQWIDEIERAEQAEQAAEQNLTALSQLDLNDLQDPEALFLPTPAPF